MPSSVPSPRFTPALNYWLLPGSPFLPASSSWPESLTTVPCTATLQSSVSPKCGEEKGSTVPGWASSSNAREKDHADQIGLPIYWVLNKHGYTVGSKQNLLIIKRENRLENQITQQTHPWEIMLSHIPLPL